MKTPSSQVSKSPKSTVRTRIVTFKFYLEAWKHAHQLGITKPDIRKIGYSEYSLHLRKN